MKQRSVIVGLALLLILLAAGQALAVVYNYNLTVPKFGGKTSTNNQAKSGYCTNVSLWVSAVGGGFTLNAGAQNVSNRDISPYARVTTGSFVSYPETIGNCNAGQLRHIQFGTDVNTLVNVQVSGSWDPG